MITFSGIVATDQPNRYNEIFPLQAMFNSYSSQWNDILPSFANHDHTKSIGYSRISGIFLQPKIAYLLNEMSFGENDEDYSRIKKYNYNYLYKKCINDNKEKYELLEKNLQDYIIDNAIRYWVNSVFIYNEGIVGRVFPNLKESIDDKGLIDIKILHPVLPGIYSYNGYLLFAHRYYRRNCSYLNTLNTSFLERIERIADEDKTLDIKIAIDFDCIGLLGTEHSEFEYQYWWGPKFNNSLKDIPLGVTRHSNEHYNELMSNIRFMDFGWYKQDKKHTFECEEITDIPNLRIDGVEMFGCRFVHSMVDNVSGFPTHLDGAIRAYDTEKMVKRIDISIKDCERDTKYTKLWRIDGALTIEKWKELITHYYRDNMMPGEYFGGNDEQITEIKKQKSDNEDKTSLKDFVPCDINSGDGLRILFSFQDTEKMDEQFDIIISSTFSLYFKDTPQKCVEIETIDLYKDLTRRGYNVCFNEMSIIDFGDMVYNYPVFYCRNQEIASDLMQSLSEFCRTWTDRRDNRVISFTIRVNYTSRMGNYSFLGHVDDFADYFVSNYSFIPTEDDIYEWLQNTYTFISKKSENKSAIQPFDIIFNNSFLTTKRKYISQNKISVHSDGGFELLLLDEEIKIVEENQIIPATVLLVKKQDCSKCNDNYMNCSCVKYLDNDISTIITDAQPLGYIWTNKSVYDYYIE